MHSLPSVEEIQKHLEQTFYKQYKDDHIRDCHVEAVINAVDYLLKLAEERITPLPPKLVMESTSGTSLQEAAEMLSTLSIPKIDVKQAAKNLSEFTKELNRINKENI